MIPLFDAVNSALGNAFTRAKDMILIHAMFGGHIDFTDVLPVATTNGVTVRKGPVTLSDGNMATNIACAYVRGSLGLNFAQLPASACDRGQDGVGGGQSFPTNTAYVPLASVTPLYMLSENIVINVCYLGGADDRELRMRQTPNSDTLQVPPFGWPTYLTGIKIPFAKPWVLPGTSKNQTRFTVIYCLVFVTGIAAIVILSTAIILQGKERRQ